jgi:hypothetical protein
MLGRSFHARRLIQVPVVAEVDPVADCAMRRCRLSTRYLDTLLLQCVDPSFPGALRHSLKRTAWGTALVVARVLIGFVDGAFANSHRSVMNGL